MRSVGPQPPAIPRPCPQCKRGLNGRPYCPYCGNTKDLEGGFVYREKPLNEQPRTSKEQTQALGSITRLQVGVTYRVVIEYAPERLKEFTGKCQWTRGSFAHFSPNWDINILEIKEIESVV